jgi:hypothetical protein
VVFGNPRTRLTALHGEACHLELVIEICHLHLGREQGKKVGINLGQMSNVRGRGSTSCALMMLSDFALSICSKASCFLILLDSSSALLPRRHVQAESVCVIAN